MFRNHRAVRRGTRTAAPFSAFGILPSLRSGQLFFLDEAKHFLHNRNARVARVRWCWGSARNAVRLPSGSSVCLRRSPHLGKSCSSVGPRTPAVSSEAVLRKRVLFEVVPDESVLGVLRSGPPQRRGPTLFTCDRLAGPHDLRPSIRELNEIRFGFNGVMVCDILTTQAVRRPRHRFQPFDADTRFTVQALAVCAVFNSPECGLHNPKAAGIVFELADG